MQPAQLATSGPGLGGPIVADRDLFPQGEVHAVGFVWAGSTIVAGGVTGTPRRGMYCATAKTRFESGAVTNDAGPSHHPGDHRVGAQGNDLVHSALQRFRLRLDS